MSSPRSTSPATPSISPAALGSPAALSTAIISHGHPPGPRFATPFGFLRTMKRDMLEFVTNLSKYGDFVCVRVPPLKTYFAFHPDDVQRVLRDNHHNYWKGPLVGKLKRIAGEGLIFSDGELWKRQRQLVQPAFQRQRVDAMSVMISDATERALEGWEQRSRTGATFDLLHELSGLTLEVVSRSLFGTAFREGREEFGDAVTRALSYADHLMGTFVPTPMWFPSAANRRGVRASRDLDRFVWRIIDEKRRARSEEEAPDLLSFLLRATNDSEAPTSDAASRARSQQLRDEMVTFLVAGHETTAVALSWTAYLLVRHPEALEQLEAEVDTVLAGRTPTPEDLPNLGTVRRVFEEAMRLYPPAWSTTRSSFEDDELGGYRVPGGSGVAVSMYVTHRHPDVWDRPERFEPDRFTAERVAARHPFAYFPFGGGPRACVGKQFAMLEGQMILAMLVQRFRLERADDRDVAPEPILTLRPADPIWMRFTPRQQAA
jgi:cytochrome P450